MSKCEITEYRGSEYKPVEVKKEEEHYDLFLDECKLYNGSKEKPINIQNTYYCTDNNGTLYKLIKKDEETATVSLSERRMTELKES